MSGNANEERTYNFGIWRREYACTRRCSRSAAKYLTQTRVRVHLYTGMQIADRVDDVYHIFTILLSPSSRAAAVYRKRERPHAPNAVFLRAPMSRAACYCLARLPPTYKRNGIRRRPTMDYRPSGARQWDAPSAPTNDTTRACCVRGARARFLVRRDSRDMTAPHHHHRYSSNIHNIRYNSLLRATGYYHSIMADCYCYYFCLRNSKFVA